MTRSAAVRGLAALVALALVPPTVANADVPVGQGENSDWAFLAKYRDSNRQLMTRPDRYRVVFMGDSITEGWAREPMFAVGGHLVGRGISGQTTSQMVVRFRQDVIALNPAVVHIMAGTNDVAGNTGPIEDEAIVGNIATMAELASTHRIRVILAAIPPADHFDWRPELRPAPRIARINAMLRSYARRNRLVFVDYGQAIGQTDGSLDPKFGPDGVHPNTAGYAAMRPLAEAAIRRAGGAATR